MTTIENIKKVPWWGKVLSVIVILAGGSYVYKKIENKPLGLSDLPSLKNKRIAARTKLDEYEDAMRNRGYKRENYIPRDDFQKVYKKWANLNDRIVDLENM
jgi:hypothetical protein